MSSYATVDDLAARWRELSPFERVIAATLLQDATDLLNVRIGDKTLTEAQHAILKPLCCKAVRRAMEAHGDAYGFDSEVGNLDTEYNPAGDLYFLDVELSALGLGAAGRIGTAPLKAATNG